MWLRGKVEGEWISLKITKRLEYKYFVQSVMINKDKFHLSPTQGGPGSPVT